MSDEVNRIVLSAVVASQQPLRFTPAGVPALNVELEHGSSVIEAGRSQEIRLTLKAVAFGSVAERLASRSVGSRWIFRGFLASGRSGKQIHLQIQDFSAETMSGAPQVSQPGTARSDGS